MTPHAAIWLSAVSSVGLVIGLPAETEPAPGPASILSDDLPPPEWRWESPADVYDRDTLYEYMNGGARFYLSYDFQALAVRPCSGPDGAKVTVELYAFASGEDAMGLFMDDLTGEALDGPWQNAVWGRGLLRLHKGNHIARIQPLRPTEAHREAQVELAGRLAQRLPGWADPPALLVALRWGAEEQEGLALGRVRYFHTKESLDSYFYLAEGNLLGLSSETECVLAECVAPGDEAARALLLLARYPDFEAADQARRRFDEERLHADVEDVGDGMYVVECEDGHWAGVAAAGASPLRCFVLDAERRELAELSARLAVEVETRLTEAMTGGTRSPAQP